MGAVTCFRMCESSRGKPSRPGHSEHTNCPLLFRSPVISTLIPFDASCARDGTGNATAAINSASAANLILTLIKLQLHKRRGPMRTLSRVSLNRERRLVVVVDHSDADVLERVHLVENLVDAVERARPGHHRLGRD